MPDTKITYHPCQGWGCHDHCYVECHTKDGKLVRTQRAILPGESADKNFICMKGILSSRIPYAEDRILYPLKRIGERGEGKFEQISWDQALDEIATKLNEITKKYGSRSIITNQFWCGYPGDWGCLQNDLIFRFIFATDSSVIENPAVDTTLFGPSIDMGDLLTSERGPLRNANNMVIIWGGNPLGYTRPSTTTRELLDAQERGAKLVHVSNLFDVTSARCDQWVPVKSGTDAYFALAMAHVLIRDGLINTKYLLRETAAAYLVRDDNGKYMREADIIDGGRENAFVVMGESGDYAIVEQLTSDEASFTGVGVSTTEYLNDSGVRSSKDYGDVKPQIDFTGEVNGIACKTSYALLCEHVSTFTPEYQETVTGIPAQTCVDLAHAYVNATPATIFVYFGLRYLNSIPTSRSIFLLSYLTGNLGQANGGSVVNQGATYHSATIMNTSGVVFPPNYTPDKAHRIETIDLLDSFENPDVQQYKAWLNPMGNPLLNWPNKTLWRTIFDNLELFVEWEIRMTDTCRWADYVLPEVTTFERHEVLSGPADVIVWCEPAIEPVGEAKDATWIWHELTKRMGLPDAFDKTNEEYAQIKARSGNSCMTSPDGQPITFERLQEEKAIQLNLPAGRDWDPFADSIWPNATGRIEFYVENLAEMGQAMASPYPNIINDSPLRDQYPLHFYSGRHKYFMQGQFTNIAECRMLASTQFGVAINPAEAEKRDMVDGEIVEVFNQRGVMRVPLNLRNDIPVNMVHTWYSFDETYYPNTACPQELETPLNTRETLTPFNEAFRTKFVQDQEAQGIPQPMIGTGMQCGESFWDCLCDIRKVR